MIGARSLSGMDYDLTYYVGQSIAGLIPAILPDCRNGEIIAVRNPGGLHHRRRDLRADVAGGAHDLAARRLACHGHRRHVRGGSSLRAAAQDSEGGDPRRHGHCGIARERGDGKFRNDDEAAAFRPRRPQRHPRGAAGREGLHVQRHRARRTQRILRELCARARLVAGAVRGSRQGLRPRANRLQDQTVSERRPRPYGRRCGARTAHHGAAVRDRGRRGRDHQIRIAPHSGHLSANDRECQVQRSLYRRLYAGPRRADGCRIHRGWRCTTRRCALLHARCPW